MDWGFIDNFPPYMSFSPACLEMPQFGCSGSRRRFDPDAPCRPAPCASADHRRTMLSRSSAKPPSSSHLWKSTNLVKPPKPIHGNLWRGGCALLALHPESVLLFLFVGFQAWVHLQNRVLVSFKHQLPDCLVHKQLGLDKMALVLLHICMVWLHSRFVMQHQVWWAEPLLQCWSILACIHLGMSQWIIYIVMVCLLRELHALRQLPLVDQWPCCSDWRNLWRGVKMCLEALENIEDTSKVDNISEMPYSLRKSPLAKSTAPTIGRLREITWVNSDTAYKGDIPYHPRLPRTSPSRSRRTFSSGSSRFGRRATPGWLFSPPAWVTKSWLPPFFTWKCTAPSPPQPVCPPGLERLLHWACWRSRTWCRWGWASLSRTCKRLFPPSPPVAMGWGRLQADLMGARTHRLKDAVKDCLSTEEGGNSKHNLEEMVDSGKIRVAEGRKGGKPERRRLRRQPPVSVSPRWEGCTSFWLVCNVF